MTEDNVRKTVCVCACVCVCERETGLLLLYSRKLTEHCKPSIIEKIKIIKKKKEKPVSLHILSFSGSWCHKVCRNSSLNSH